MVRRVLITGGTGFVGVHLIRFLNPSVSAITVLGLSAASIAYPEPGVSYYEVDIRRSDDVSSLVQATKPTEIYHLAAISAVDVCWSNPRLAFEVNVTGTFNVFEAAMRLPCVPRILNISTAQVYAPSYNALVETSPISPNNPYAATKAMAELLPVQWRKTTTGGVITARSFNHTGPGQSEIFVLSSFAKQFAEIQAGVRSPELSVGNIDVKRDFTDVRDVVRAYEALMKTGRIAEVYNVCSGVPVRLADVISECQSMCGVKAKVCIDPAKVRANDVSEIIGDPSKVRTETGWIPQIPLQNTIRDLIQYWTDKIRCHHPIEA